MAFLQNVPGTWGIGKFKLPDFGITEMLRMWAGKTPSAEQTTTFNNPNVIRATVGSTAPYQPPKQNQRITTQVYTQPVPSGGGGGGGGGNRGNGYYNANGDWVSIGQSSGPSQEDLLVQQRQRELEAINAEYEQEMARLSGLEPQVKERYKQYISQAEQYFPKFEEEVKKQEQQRLGELGNIELQRKQEASTAISKVKALLNDLQRRQQAYLSATGGFSSNVPEAMSEQFGRQAFQSLSQIQSQRDQALRDIENERVKAQNFYSNKLLEAKQSYDTQVNQLKSQLMAALDQISQAKGAAASAKRAQAIDVWRNYTANKLNLDMEYQKRQQDLAQWMLQMQAQLDQAKAYQTGNITGLNYGSILQNLQNPQTSVFNPQTVPSLVGRVLGKNMTWEDLIAMQNQNLNPNAVGGSSF